MYSTLYCLTKYLAVDEFWNSKVETYSGTRYKKCKKFGIKWYGLFDCSGYTCDMAAYLGNQISNAVSDIKIIP